VRRFSKHIRTTIIIYLTTVQLNYHLGQNTFEKTFGSLNYEEIWDSKILSDSTLILSGYTGFGNALFIKTDLNGDTIWTRELVDPGIDLIYSV